MSQRQPRFLPKGRPFFIAEAGVNHNGSLDLALKLVDAAADAGADAVKFQTFRADALAADSAPQADYQKRSGRMSQKEMLKRLEFTPAMHKAALERCRLRRILFLSTPFDEQSADYLDGLGMPIFKIPSGEVTNHPFLAHIARKRKPVILSTGMSTLPEVRAALGVLRRAGAPSVTLLHCVSSYPAPAADANLRAMETMRRAFKVPVGYSDHSLGLEVSIAAAALGASVVEKHFTLDRTMKGPDHAASLEPSELKTLTASLKSTSLALGDGEKKPRPCERDVMTVARRSIVLRSDTPAGRPLRESDLAFKRPATGIAPYEVRRVLGRRLKRAARADTVLTWSLLK